MLFYLFRYRNLTLTPTGCILACALLIHLAHTVPFLVENVLLEPVSSRLIILFIQTLKRFCL